MITNFPNDRRIHCETGCFVNTMKYYGIDITEEMVFGVGGGIYLLFTSWIKLDGLPLLILRAKPSHLYRKASERLGLTAHEMTFGDDKDRAMSALAELVDRDIPVTVVSNIFHIPYMAPFTPDKMNFNGHNMVIIGREGDRYTVADPEMKLPNDDYTFIDDVDLRITRFMPGPHTPHGRLFYFDKPDPDKFKDYDFRPACLKGLKEACYNMVGIPFPYFGAKGIHYMSKQVRNWDRKYTREQIEDALYNYYRLLERAGTGGSGYRYLYARFLEQCGEMFQSEALAASAESLIKAADAWRTISVDILHYRKNKGVTLGELADVLEEASKHEYDTFHNIKKNFLNKRKRF